MKYTTILLGLCVLFLTTIPAGAESVQAKDVTLSKGKTVGLPWKTSDGAGYTWDIYQNGNVNNGSNYAYGNGMMLHVRGNQFYVQHNQIRLRPDEKEIQLGPWQNNNIRVWRRIYVDPEIGYARWIDIFENTDTQKAAKVNVRYENHMGNSVRQCTTTTGQSLPTEKDWGFVSDDNPNESRPAVMHIYASKRSKHRPTAQVQMNNNRIQYEMTLTIPPGEVRALCFFEAQRGNVEEASDLLKTFFPERELAKLPRTLREIIVNITGDVLLTGRLVLPRSRKDDTIVLQDDSEVHGTIQNASYSIDTFFGKLTLPAKDVAGLVVIDPNDRHVQIALTDGEIVGGVMGRQVLQVRLADGKELKLPLRRLATMSYRISPEKPEELSPRGAMLVLRSGQQLRFDPAALPLEFLTEYGPVRLPAEDLCDLRFTNEGRLHQAVFRNGSVLTGLLQARTVQATLPLGPQLTTDRETLSAVLYNAPGKPGGPFRLQLRNDDILLGQLADKELPIETELGEITIPTQRLRTLQRVEGTADNVRVKLVDETTVTGRLKQPTLRFQITPGVILPVYVGHVVNMRHESAKKETKNNAATTPHPPPVRIRRSRPVVMKLEAPRAAKITVREAREENQKKIDACRQKAKRLQALIESKEKAVRALQEKIEKMKKLLAQKPDDKELQARLRKHEGWTITIQSDIGNYKKELAILGKQFPTSQPTSKPTSRPAK